MDPAGTLPAIPFEARIKFTLDYVEKEITAMGWLAGISAAIGGAAISQPLFHAGNGDLRLGALLSEYPESAIMLIGCTLLFVSAACFLAQRIKLTTRYGQACGIVLSDNDPTDFLNYLIGWKAWRPYKWGLDLMGIGGVQTAVGLVFLSWRVAQPGQIQIMTRPVALLAAVLAPAAVLGILKAARRNW